MLVFLSYKASMSDALETIYLAAKADPTCDAIWIPVPYFDVNPDDSLGDMHYEGQEFYGEDVVCTDWREYDLAEHRPDAIFTFAPYDEFNRVTRVHADFFCSRLRELTKALVYIPYFVVGDPNVEEHFCLLPGCVYANLVILQSETVAQRYRAVFGQEYGDSWGPVSEKFQAFGSPKLDRMLSLSADDFSTPDEWCEHLGETSVVLFNTGIDGLLRGNIEHLRKILLVIAKFEERADTVLWWRPHPLSQQTLASMLPDFAAVYGEVVDFAKRAHWVIYDDSADLHRAIAWSDAYYGDWSSVLMLFLGSGKPMMIADDAEIVGALGDESSPRPLGQRFAMNPAMMRELTGCLYRESPDRSLEAFADYVKSQRSDPLQTEMDMRARRVNVFKEMNTYSDGYAGEAIYLHMRRLLG